MSGITNPNPTAQKKKVVISVVVLLFVLFLELNSTLQAAPTVNVSFSGSQAISLQSDFINGATNQYVGPVVKSAYFPDTYSMVISGKRDFTPPPVVTPPMTSTGTYIVQIGENTKMIYQSTVAINEVFAYGFADGEIYERHDTANIMGSYLVNCSSPTFWTVAIDSTTCNRVLGTLYGEIMRKNYADPTLVPIPTDWWY